MKLRFLTDVGTVFGLLLREQTQFSRPPMLPAPRFQGSGIVTQSPTASQTIPVPRHSNTSERRLTTSLWTYATPTLKPSKSIAQRVAATSEPLWTTVGFAQYSVGLSRSKAWVDIGTLDLDAQLAESFKTRATASEIADTTIYALYHDTCVDATSGTNLHLKLSWAGQFEDLSGLPDRIAVRDVLFQSIWKALGQLKDRHVSDCYYDCTGGGAWFTFPSIDIGAACGPEAERTCDGICEISKGQCIHKAVARALPYQWRAYVQDAEGGREPAWLELKFVSTGWYFEDDAQSGPLILSSPPKYVNPVVHVDVNELQD
ncbi:hypothetical protein PYCC9005_001051 [Savitreella phatthalungensis]